MARLFLFAAFGLVGTLGPLEPTQATAFNYPWCAIYNMQNGVRSCGFTTLAQCQATVSGIGGYCDTNPAYVPPAPASRSRTSRPS